MDRLNAEEYWSVFFTFGGALLHLYQLMHLWLQHSPIFFC